MLSNDLEIVDKRYRVIDKLNYGAFGEIYRVERRLTKEIYALKCEKHVKNAKNPILPTEVRIMKQLRSARID